MQRLRSLGNVPFSVNFGAQDLADIKAFPLRAPPIPLPPHTQAYYPTLLGDQCNKPLRAEPEHYGAL